MGDVYNPHGILDTFQDFTNHCAPNAQWTQCCHSSSNKYGPVSKGLVFGVATAVIWPPARWSTNNHCKIFALSTCHLCILLQAFVQVAAAGKRESPQSLQVCCLQHHHEKNKAAHIYLKARESGFNQSSQQTRKREWWRRSGFLLEGPQKLPQSVMTVFWTSHYM